MTDLQTELAALIQQASRQFCAEDPVYEDEAAFIAERLAPAFQQVGWRNSVGSHIDYGWAEGQGRSADYDASDRWEPVYRFARPEQ